MTSDVFLGWMHKFAQCVTERPLLLLCDGHCSHVSLDVISFARSNGITILKFPSHTTHVLQPLDVSVFTPLKCAWDKRVIQFQKEHGFNAMSKSDEVNVLSSVWQVAVTDSNVRTGFETTGTSMLQNCFVI
jgi:hypothetical protein